MTNIHDLPPEILWTIFKELDGFSALTFGDKGTPWIDVIREEGLKASWKHAVCDDLHQPVHSILLIVKLAMVCSRWHNMIMQGSPFCGKDTQRFDKWTVLIAHKVKQLDNEELVLKRFSQIAYPPKQGKDQTAKAVDGGMGPLARYRKEQLKAYHDGTLWSSTTRPWIF